MWIKIPRCQRTAIVSAPQSMARRSADPAQPPQNGEYGGAAGRRGQGRPDAPLIEKDPAAASAGEWHWTNSTLTRWGNMGWLSSFFPKDGQPPGRRPSRGKGPRHGDCRPTPDKTPGRADGIAVAACPSGKGKKRGRQNRAGRSPRRVERQGRGGASSSTRRWPMAGLEGQRRRSQAALKKHGGQAGHAVARQFGLAAVAVDRSGNRMPSCHGPVKDHAVGADAALAVADLPGQEAAVRLRAGRSLSSISMKSLPKELVL